MYRLRPGIVLFQPICLSLLMEKVFKSTAFLTIRLTDKLVLAMVTHSQICKPKFGALLVCVISTISA